MNNQQLPGPSSFLSVFSLPESVEPIRTPERAGRPGRVGLDAENPWVFHGKPRGKPFNMISRFFTNQNGESMEN
jgi:hypothetical protein